MVAFCRRSCWNCLWACTWLSCHRSIPQRSDCIWRIWRTATGWQRCQHVSMDHRNGDISWFCLCLVARCRCHSHYSPRYHLAACRFRCHYRQWAAVAVCWMYLLSTCCVLGSCAPIYVADVLEYQIVMCFHCCTRASSMHTRDLQTRGREKNTLIMATNVILCKKMRTIMIFVYLLKPWCRKSYFLSSNSAVETLTDIQKKHLFVQVINETCQRC